MGGLHNRKTYETPVTENEHFNIDLKSGTHTRSQRSELSLGTASPVDREGRRTCCFFRNSRCTAERWCRRRGTGLNCLNAYILDIAFLTLTKDFLTTLLHCIEKCEIYRLYWNVVSIGALEHPLGTKRVPFTSFTRSRGRTWLRRDNFRNRRHGRSWFCSIWCRCSRR